jgi:uncharacterized repeat protein (TIGR01451 family)
LPPPGDDLELPTPVVSLRVAVPSQASLGQEVEYRITVTNRSAAPAHRVVVRDRLPANARFVRSQPPASATEPELLWELGTLAPGERREISLVLQASEGSELDNAVRVQFEHGVRLRTQLLRPALQLKKDGPAETQVSARVSYRLTVTNTGSLPAHNVTVTDELPDGLEHPEGHRVLHFPLGTLRPGETRQVSYEVVASRRGKFTNRAKVTADGVVQDEVQFTIAAVEPALDFSMRGPSEQSFQRSLTYELRVTNTGDVPVSQVVVLNPLPPKTTFVSASHGGRLVDSQVRWDLGTVEPGASRSLELKLRPLAPGRLVNTAEVRTEQGLRRTAQAATEIIGEAGLLLEVVDLQDPIEVGGDTQYNIIIRNQGSVPARNIRIVAIVPREMAVARVQGPTDHRKEGNEVRFEPLDLPPGRDTVYRVFVRALEVGDVRFRVELTSDQLPAGPLREEESTNIVPRDQDEDREDQPRPDDMLQARTSPD